MSQENLSLKKSAPQPAPQANGTRPAPAAPGSTPRRPSDRSRPSRERPSGRPELQRKDVLDIFADPPSLSKSPSTSGTRDKPVRRPRRNSESSVMDRASKLLDDDDERRRRERRHRDREGRHRDGKHRSSRKNHRLDIIDKLDVTSIYGTGSEFL